MKNEEKKDPVILDSCGQPIPGIRNSERPPLKKNIVALCKSIPPVLKLSPIILGVLLTIASIVWDEFDKPGLQKLKNMWDTIAHSVKASDQGMFTVAMAQFEGDIDGSVGDEIMIGLVDLDGFDGVNKVKISRTIFIGDDDVKEQTDNGHQLARDYLQKCQADILIWGRVFQDQKLRLCWTTANQKGVRPYFLDRGSFLPPLFIDDFKAVLHTLILSQYATKMPEGHYVVDHLSPFMERMRKLLSGQPNFKANELAILQFIYANALHVIGKQSGNAANLNEALELYVSILGTKTKEQEPHNWAVTQNNLGVLLGAIGELEKDTVRLEESVAAHRRALDVFSRDFAPLDWAGTQNNLGVALQKLGERESEPARLEESIIAHRLALEEWTREGAPVDWAKAQVNLGNVLNKLGARETGTTRLEESLAAYQLALTVFSRERNPLYWASIQSGLGFVLESLWERGSGTDRLENSIVAYRLVLEVETRERVPLEWADSQNNLGNALQSLGEHEKDKSVLRESITAYRLALEVLEQKRAPFNWARTQNNLGVTLRSLGELEKSTSRLEESLSAFCNALEERTRENAPRDWAMTQHNIGDVLYRLGQAESSEERLEESVTAYRNALEERTRENLPRDWAVTQHNLGLVLRKLAERTNEISYFREALVCYLNAFEVYKSLPEPNTGIVERGVEKVLSAVRFAGFMDDIKIDLTEVENQMLNHFLRENKQNSD